MPTAPGSWGSLVALPLAWVIAVFWGILGLGIAAATAFLVGWWAAATIARASAVEDPGAIVIDEVAGQWLVLVAVPPALLPYALAFLLFRIFDIWKPWPARWAEQRVRGGLGIMLDDVVAAVYAVCLLSILVALGGVIGVRN